MVGVIFPAVNLTVARHVYLNSTTRLWVQSVAKFGGKMKL
jgi:hypothetical protein